MSTPEGDGEGTTPAESTEVAAPAESTEAAASAESTGAALATTAETSSELAAATGQNTGPLGEERGVGFAIVMLIVTLGIYGLYWLYKTFAELKRHRNEGVGGIVGILLCLVIVGYFKLPQYVGRMYRAEGNEDPPVSGLSGLWVFVPYVGTLIWIAKVQGALNRYWSAKGAGTVATVPSSAASF